MRSKMFYISKFCLLCLKEDDGSLQDVKKKDTTGVTIQEKLDYCVFELISSGHEFPGFICHECLGLLETLYVFKQKCFKSNRKIRNFMDSLKQMQFSALSYRDLSVPVQKLENIISSPTRGLLLVPSSRKEISSSIKRQLLVRSPKQNFSLPTERNLSKKEIETKIKKKVAQFPKLNLFGCDICKKQFATKFLLKRHLKSHANIKPYECTNCFTRFTRKDSLKCHQKLHCKPLKSICQETKIPQKTQRNVINKTRKINKAKKSYKCGLCPVIITHKTNLKRHFLRFHVKSKEDFNLSYNVIESSNQDLNLQSADLTNGEWSDADTTSTLTSPEIDLESFDDDVILLDDIEQEEMIHNTTRNNKNVSTKTLINKSPILTEKHLKEMDDNNLLCFICNKNFARKCKLSAHIGSHFGDTPYKN